MTPPYSIMKKTKPEKNISLSDEEQLAAIQPMSSIHYEIEEGDTGNVKKTKIIVYDWDVSECERILKGLLNKKL